MSFCKGPRMQNVPGLCLKACHFIHIGPHGHKTCSRILETAGSMEAQTPWTNTWPELRQCTRPFVTDVSVPHDSPGGSMHLGDAQENYLAKFEAYRRTRANTIGSVLGNPSICPSPSFSGGSLSTGASRVKHIIKPSPLSRGAERTPMSKSRRPM